MLLRKLAISMMVLASGTGATALAAGTRHTAHAHAKRLCQRFASTSGSDRTGQGTRRRPFRTVGRLDRSLRPGQTGCLGGGTYGSIHTRFRFMKSGSRDQRITIRSVPGQTATLRGYVMIIGSYVTLSRLKIDGSNAFYTQHPSGVNCPTPTSEPLTIAGDNDTLQHDDYYQSVPSLRGNGIGIGFWGPVSNTVIRFNKIHDVGQCQAYDHLIYLSHGNNTQIYGNWLWNDPHGRAVQLYPAPTNSKIFNNVIDHVGEGFAIGDESGETVSGNQIFNNIVSNSTGLPWEHIPGEAIHDMYGGRPGTGNSFHNNDLFHNPGGLGHVSAVKVYGNSTSMNPEYVDAAGHNYELRRPSRLIRQHLWRRNYLRAP
ncbi:MAG TPA: right-handed parallel beta-helix repeat-containing protein [Solirubrobacteraceae bacterium]